jgi:predicted AAA+ superfamily ATPase
MFKERSVSDKLCQAVGTFRVVVVSGARQTGKTTLLRHLFPTWDFVTFDPVTDVENARADPDLFLDNHPAPAVLDEVQYAPEVVAALKRRIDRNGDRPGQYILTGSQQWQVMRVLAESLAGRAVFVDLQGLSLAEYADAPESLWLAKWLADPESLMGDAGGHRLANPLPRWLWRGSLPGTLQVEDALIPAFWEAYQRTYIERDARAMAALGDWQQFGLFLRLAGALSAQEVNASHFGRDIGVTPRTARKWLDILSGTFQWFEVPAWHGNVVKRVASKPKGYLADTGLICHGQRISSAEALSGHPMLGALFETAIVNDIRRQSDALAQAPGFWHWRSAGGAEVDLILERDGILYPLEIRLTSNPRPRDVSGLAAWRASYPAQRMAPGLVVCAVERPRRITPEVFALPWDWIPAPRVKPAPPVA